MIRPDIEKWMDFVSNAMNDDSENTDIWMVRIGILGNYALRIERAVHKMREPTKDQIKKFIAYVNDLAEFQWIHSANQPPEPDLVAVSKWLKEKSCITDALEVKGEDLK